MRGNERCLGRKTAGVDYVAYLGEDRSQEDRRSCRVVRAWREPRVVESGHEEGEGFEEVSEGGACVQHCEGGAVTGKGTV